MAENSNAPANQGVSAELGGHLQEDHSATTVSPYGLLARWQMLGEACRDKRLSHADDSVLFTVLEHVNSESGEAWPSYETIASKSGVNRGAVSRALKRLVEAGYLTVESGHAKRKANRYRMTRRNAATSKDASSGTASSRSTSAARSNFRRSLGAVSLLKPAFEPTDKQPAARAFRESSVQPVQKRDFLASPESPLESALSYIRHQHQLGAYGEGQEADDERDRLIAEARRRHALNEEAA